MASFDITKAINDFFIASWPNNRIQFHGTTLDGTNQMDNYISLIYNPVENDPYGFNGSATGRIRYAGLQKVFCYAKSPTLALKLADEVKAFMNGQQIDNIAIDIGQDRQPTDLGTGFYEVLCIFNLNEWT